MNVSSSSSDYNNDYYINQDIEMKVESDEQMTQSKKKRGIDDLSTDDDEFPLDLPPEKAQKIYVPQFDSCERVLECNDLLSYVLTYVSAEDKIRYCRLVNKKWKDCSNAISSWKAINGYEDFFLKNGNLKFSKILHCIQKLEYFKLPEQCDINDSTLIEVAQKIAKGKCLKSLYIWDLPNCHQEEVINTFLPNNPQNVNRIKQLSLATVLDIHSSENILNIINQCPDIELLEIVSQQVHQRFSEDQAIKIISKLPKLKNLNIGYQTFNNWINIIPSMSKEVNSITLDILPTANGADDKDKCNILLTHLSENFSHITDLFLGILPFAANDDICKLIRSNNNLIKIMICEVNAPPDISSGSLLLDDSFLNTIADNCPHLMELNVTGGEFIIFTTDGLINVIRNCPWLTSLQIRGTHLIFDDYLLNAIADNCPNLTTLHLEGGELTAFTSEGLINLANKCHFLNSLELTGAGNSFSTLALFCLTKCKYLKDISLMGVDQTRLTQLQASIDHYNKVKQLTVGDYFLRFLTLEEAKSIIVYLIQTNPHPLWQL